jgi:hypothetical protein
LFPDYVIYSRRDMRRFPKIACASVITPAFLPPPLGLVERTCSVRFELAEYQLRGQGGREYYVDVVAADVSGVQDPPPMVAVLMHRSENNDSLATVEAAGAIMHPLLFPAHPPRVGIE